jgi:hypothetical protein
MSGSRQYYQKCVCGSEIKLFENYELMSSSRMEEQFEAWHREHNNCLVLFHTVQKIRMERLTPGLVRKIEG